MARCSWFSVVDLFGPLVRSVMQSGVDLNPKDLAQRAESLIRHSSNRYLTTVRIAYRAKQRRFDDFDGLLDESMVKPVQRAIVELSDEQDQPDLLPG
jgi:DNA-directed RNA polymerase subunit omega